MQWWNATQIKSHAIIQKLRADDKTEFWLSYHISNIIFLQHCKGAILKFSKEYWILSGQNLAGEKPYHIHFRDPIPSLN